MIGQVDTAVKAVNSITAREGVFAGLFAATLIFICWLLYRLGNAFIENTREHGNRIASSTESMDHTTARTADAIEAISAALNELGVDVGQVKEAIVLALKAIKEDDEKQRHFLIDEARKKLE